MASAGKVFFVLDTASTVQRSCDSWWDSSSTLVKKSIDNTQNRWIPQSVPSVRSVSRLTKVELCSPTTRLLEPTAQERRQTAPQYDKRFAPQVQEREKWCLIMTNKPPYPGSPTTDSRKYGSPFCHRPRESSGPSSW